MRKEGVTMAKTIRVRINSQVRRTNRGTVQIRTSVNNGHSTKITTKTIRVK